MNEPIHHTNDSQKFYQSFNHYIEQVYLEASIEKVHLKLPTKQELMLEEFSKNEHSAKLIFHQKELRFLYITDNIQQILGYPAEDFMKFNISLLFKLLTFEHLTFPITMAKWSTTLYKILPPDVLKNNMRVTYCGVKMKRRDKRVVRLLVRYAPLEFDTNGLVKVAILTIEDITHLMKADFFWGRTVCGDDDKHIFHIISTTGKNQNQDIISEREKDVLRLIALGMESKEIAQKLFISTHTVDNHRKNMLLRTGVRDTTALVQLSRMCGII